MRRSLVALLMLALLVVCGSFGVVEAHSVSGGYGGGGPVAATLRLSLAELNKQLKASGFPELDDTVVMIGGGGAGGTLSWNVGGLGMGGEITSTTANNEVRLSIGLGGFSVERCVPVGSVTLTGGLLLGAGSAKLMLVDVVSGANLEDALANRYETTIENNFLTAVPMAGVRVRLAQFVFLEAKGGYMATLGEWKMQGRVISGLPKVGGTMLQLGVMFGGSTH